MGAGSGCQNLSAISDSKQTLQFCCLQLVPILIVCFTAHIQPLSQGHRQSENQFSMPPLRFPQPYFFSYLFMKELPAETYV